MQTIEVPGLYGLAAYKRFADGPVALQVPFQNSTFELKDALKALGFVCRYDERMWELSRQRFDEQVEERLRYLLTHGELPTAPVAAPAAAPAAGVSGTPAQRRERRHGRDEEGDEEGGAAPPPPVPFHDGAVLLRLDADGRMVLEGAALEHISPMLERLMHFTRLAPAAAAAGGAAGAAAAVGAVPSWRSDRPLSGAERAFVIIVLEHRKAKLLGGEEVDDKEPIPPAAVVPLRFKPQDPEGRVMRGPYKTRVGGNGMPHNWGRQFFSNFRQGLEGGFLWADGTEAFSEEAGDRFLGWAEDEGVPAVLHTPGGPIFVNMP